MIWAHRMSHFDGSDVEIAGLKCVDGILFIRLIARGQNGSPSLYQVYGCSMTNRASKDDYILFDHIETG